MVDYSQYNNPRNNDLPFTSNGGNNEFLRNIPNVSPEVFNLGLSAGQDMLNKQREKWMPGVSSFWIDLKSYFAVNFVLISRNCYVYFN